MSVWEWWSLAVVALCLKMWAVAMLQGQQRLKHKVFVRPEDALFFGRTEPAEQELPLVRLAAAVLRNDLENIPCFALLALAYAQLECWPQAAPWYFGAFVTSRVVHSLAYLRPTQPLRNLAYVSGLLVCAVMAAHIVWQVL